ncbi:EAL domain-containing protein [Vibrio sinaloensis]|uniref:EAL domain-containing protein n=1 Tax=Photobacterium sp. (strain ATCC 43367) TaxID=379097 RepID=UPI00204AE4AD|nr:EAL domain-containing protein [Vibrio sinaloensis]UPQ89140.1 EAL domain-containing protein [Vibrio sinaloensis]
MDKQTLPQLLLSLLDTASEGLWFMGDDNVVQFYNSTFYQQFNLPSGSPSLEDWLELVHPQDRTQLVKEVELYQKYHTTSRVKTRYRVKNLSGRYLWIEVTGVRAEFNGGFAMVGSHKDVSDEVFLNQYLTHMANHDSETGLFNRHYFLQNFPRFKEKGWLFVCCLTQLQQFQRRVGNDASGALSSTLVSTLDHVFSLKYGLYRISADVFVVQIDEELDAALVLELMKQIESEFQGQSQLKGCSSILTSRVGIGALPVNIINPENPLEQIFNLSEYARLVSSPVTYTDDSQHDIDRYFEIHDALEEAIESHQITIALQPIIEGLTGNIISFEALARWNHPVLGHISPIEFIPIAEKQGYIHALGMLVLTHACQYLTTFDETHAARPLINVNVSAHQLLKDSFVDDVFDVATQAGVSPSRIVLEVTESYLLDENPTINRTLNILHTHGFKLSIDDFGSGMSAVTSLFRLPLYQVKLDRSLINEAMRLDACMKLITYLCDFGRGHNIALVAEGVETTDMLDKLIKIGVPYLQGYCLYRPSEPQVWLEYRKAESPRD